MNNQSVFIVTSTFFEPGEGPMLGTGIEGVFTSLELAEQHVRTVEERDEHSALIVMCSIVKKTLNDPIN